jgi:glycyl-tRNA synthetase beta chain
MTKKNLILEIGTEEIPSRFMPGALADLREYTAAQLNEQRIAFNELATYGTPRRLVLVIKGLSEKQEDVVHEYKGPKWEQAFDSNGNPTKAALGFARSRKVDFESLETREIGGIEYAYAVISESGSASEELLPGIMHDVVSKLVFPKNMYWDNPSVRFARPIRWILCLLEDKVINFSYGGIGSGRVTRGHRFMGAKSIEISSFDEYMSKLYDNYVIVDQEKRKEKMLCGISAIEKELEGKADISPELVEENLYLVEYPVPFYGAFDRTYLEMPEEVLTTTMIHHQKYFPVRDANGKLLPYFVGVSNNRATNMQVVREGNERVLRARLSDASFFWNEDRKEPLSSKVEKLRNVVYQEKIGTLYDKVMYTRAIASRLCDNLGHSDLKKTVERAALLAKTDLLTNMVFEFPELQGIMGREYARHQDEPEEVALALYEQYLPKFAGDILPSGTPGAILGLSERIYNMVSCFKADLQGTGSQDPYGLRRASRCINEIIWGLDLDLDIEKAMASACQELEAPDDILNNILAFFRQRLLMQLKEKGYTHEMVTMAISLIGNRPLQVLKLLVTFAEIQEEAWFTDLITAAVRVRNILSKAKNVPSGISTGLLIEETEIALHKKVEDLTPQVQNAVSRSDWKELSVLLSELSPSITAFFDNVLVMDKDEKIRDNRLALLERCNRLFMEAGDLGSLKA